MDNNFKVAIAEIVEGCFEDKNLRELIQGAKDKIVIDGFKMRLKNLKR